MIYGAFNTSSDGVLVAFDSLALGWQVIIIVIINIIIAIIIVITIITIITNTSSIHHHHHNNYNHHRRHQRPSLGPGLPLPVLIATVEAIARF